MSWVDLCDGVAGGDAPSDDVNCGDVCCDSEVLWWWCCWSAGVLGRANPPTVIYLYMPLFIGDLTPLCMHMVIEMLAWSYVGRDIYPSHGQVIRLAP
jgi:hypothetical protein